MRVRERDRTTLAWRFQKRIRAVAPDKRKSGDVFACCDMPHSLSRLRCSLPNVNAVYGKRYRGKVFTERWYPSSS